MTGQVPVVPGGDPQKVAGDKDPIAIVELGAANIVSEIPRTPT